MTDTLTAAPADLGEALETVRLQINETPMWPAWTPAVKKTTRVVVLACNCDPSDLHLGLIGRSARRFAPGGASSTIEVDGDDGTCPKATAWAPVYVAGDQPRVLRGERALALDGDLAGQVQVASGDGQAELGLTAAILPPGPARPTNIPTIPDRPDPEDTAVTQPDSTPNPTPDTAEAPEAWTPPGPLVFDIPDDLKQQIEAARTAGVDAWSPYVPDVQVGDVVVILDAGVATNPVGQLGVATHEASDSALTRAGLTVDLVSGGGMLDAEAWAPAREYGPNEMPTPNHRILTDRTGVAYIEVPAYLAQPLGQPGEKSTTPPAAPEDVIHIESDEGQAPGPEDTPDAEGNPVAVLEALPADAQQFVVLLAVKGEAKPEEIDALSPNARHGLLQHGVLAEHDGNLCVTELGGEVIGLVQRHLAGAGQGDVDRLAAAKEQVLPDTVSDALRAVDRMRVKACRECNDAGELVRVTCSDPKHDVILGVCKHEHARVDVADVLPVVAQAFAETHAGYLEELRAVRGQLDTAREHLRANAELALRGAAAAGVIQIQDEPAPAVPSQG